MDMKKIWGVALTAAVLFSGIQPVSFADGFPSVIYSEEEGVEFGWENMTSYNTLPPQASFYINFTPKTRNEVQYNVNVSVLNGKTYDYSVNVPNDRTTHKSFTLTLDKGKHDITVEIKNKDEVVKTITQSITVMEPYTHQFMDEFTTRGVNTHFGRPGYMENVPELLDAVEGMGLTLTRDSKEWWSAEPSRGVYSFPEYFEEYEGRKIKNMYLSAYGNPNYITEDGLTQEEQRTHNTANKIIPKTPESLKAYAEFTMASADFMKSVNNSETVLVYNEPNISFNKSEVMPFDGDLRQMAGVYTDLFKSTSVQLLKNGYDWVDVGGLELAAAQNEFANLAFEYGAYPLMDTYGYHPYPGKDAFRASYNLYRSEEFFSNALLEFGGWKKRTWSETGFPTITGTDSISTEESAEGIVKIYSYADLVNIDEVMVYDLLNDGSDRSYVEHNWGMFTEDLTPKEVVPAVAQFNKKTSGAVIVGNVDLGYGEGTKCIVYNKDSKPVIVAWSDEADLEVTFEGENVSVEDIYGNDITQTNTVKISESPVYIENVSDGYFAMAAQGMISELNSVWLEHYSQILPPDIAGSAESTFKNAEDMCSALPGAEQALEAFKDYESLGNTILALGSSGNLSDLEVSKMLYELYRPMEFLMGLYISVYDGENVPVPTSSYDAAYEKAKTLYKDHVKTMQYSDEVLNYAKRYSEKAKTLAGLEENPMKAGVMAGWNTMTDVLCAWFDKFTEFEKTENIGLLIQIPHYEKVSYTNSNINLRMNLTNYSYEDFSGKIECYDKNGEKIGETGHILLKADEETVEQYISFPTEKEMGTDYSRYTLKYVSDSGEVAAEQVCDIKVMDKFNVNMLPLSMETEDVSSMTAEVENLTDEDQEIVINIEGDDNIKFARDSINTVVPAGETVNIELPISQIKDTDYHFYTFSYEAYDAEGVLYAAKKSAISFTAITKADAPIDVQGFNGDISDWKDAYPIYINEPLNVADDGEWKESDISARVYAKWDSGHLYILADVYDDKHLQEYYGTNMWQGDSIQISVDPNNDKAEKYAEDDYEIGISKTFDGTQVYAWQSPVPIPEGEAAWAKVVRDDENCTTRYLAAIDTTVINNLPFKNGTVFGMNFALNDADILGRDTFVQFTKGTADTKNPSFYADFKFTGGDSNEIADDIFPDLDSASWAEEAISALHEKGTLSGDENGNFRPNDFVTREEFSVMLVKAFDFYDANAETQFSDVPSGHWAYRYISSAYNKNIISGIGDGMFGAGMNISRQDMAVMSFNAAAAGGRQFENGNVEFEDSEQIAPYAQEAVSSMYNAGIINGVGENLFDPKGNATRAQAAQIIYGLIF